MQLHFEKFGNGPPLIVLHGLFGSLENWRPLNYRFAQRFEVFAVDQRNHGCSPHSPEMTFTAMADDLRELLDENRLVSAHVLGHSMGGKTAMRLALLHPNRVKKLVVVDIAPRAYPPSHRDLLDSLLGLQLNHFETRQHVEDALSSQIPDLAVRRFLLKNLSRDDAGRLVWRLGLHELAANYNHLLEPVATDQVFEGPALFLRGEQSEYVNEADLPLIRRLFPKGVLRGIPGAGHWVHAEQPEAVAEAVLSFLS